MAATRTRIKIKKPEGDEGALVVTTITEPIDPPPDGSGTEISSTEIKTRGSSRPKRDGVSPVPVKEKKKHKHKKHKRHKHEKHHHRDRHHHEIEPQPSTSTDTSIAAEPSSAETTNQGIEEKMEEDGAEQNVTTAEDDGLDATFDDFLKSLSAPSHISETQAAAEKILAETDTEGPGVLCSLCNCGERSLLGQGDMTQYEPTPNYNHAQGFKKLLAAKGTRRGSSETDKEKEGEKSQSPPSQPKKPKRSQRERSKSPRRQAGPLSCRTSQDERNKYIPDELAMVGHAEDTDVSKVFEENGITSAHHCCAAWSEGVIQAEDYTLQYVDKAVVAGLTQKCHYCQRYGATIFCRHPKCNRKYHYPCAPASGCFQDIKTMSLLCPDHTDQAEEIAGMESFCVVCDAPGDILEQLFCTSCGQHYHGNCLDPPVEMNPVVRAGWQCPECKICQTCRQPGDDNKMLVCDTCDKGYHTFCLRPAMTTIPKNGWKCKNCRICGDCGSKTAGSKNTSRWHLNYTVCESCYQHRNKGQSCPVCQRAYSAKNITQLSMVNCQLCKRYVHLDCDQSADFSGPEAMAARACYVCPLCHDNASNNEAVDNTNLTESLTAMIEQTDLKDLDALDLFKDTQTDRGVANSSQDSLLLSEESLHMDVDAEKNRYAGSSDQSVYSGKPVRSHGPGKGKPSIGKKKFLFGKYKGRNPYTGKKRRTHLGEKKRSRAPKYKSSSSSNKGGDDDDHHSTVVLCSSKDDLVLKQDMCLACGSYGFGEEGKLIACTQCGQCYHPYCVSIKVTKIVLQKGWRCLDCTVCEGCGKPHDEGRLILCDECDISYHIYCLDPPLDHVPKGTWKCKWCAVCTTCGTTKPGFACTWQTQYSQCGPCASYTTCPFCQRKYIEDELIIQCTQCDRWLHAGCDNLKSEDEAEKASDFGYQCMFCRMVTGAGGPLPPPPTPSPEPEPEPVPSPQTVWHQEYPPKQTRYFTMDGVQLSENGFAHVKSITVESPAKKRTLRLKTQEPAMSKHPSITRLLSMSERSDMSEEFEEGFLKDRGDTHDDEDHDHDHDMDESYEKKDGVPDPEKKKRQRHRKPGIGGFIPRPKGGRSIFKKGTLITKLPLELMPPGDREREEKILMLEGRKKKKLGRKKGPLEDSYPSYLQEAFFGTLLEKPALGDMELDDLSEEEKKDEFSPRVKETFNLSPRKDPDDDHLVGEDLKDMIDLLPNDLPHDEEILDMIGEDFKEPADDSQDELEMPTAGHGKDNLTERFDQMLGGDVGKTLDVDKMLTEGLAQIDSKMVEDIFKGVLSPHPSSTSPGADQAGTAFNLPPVPPATVPSAPRPQPPTTLAPFPIPQPQPQHFHGGDFSPQFSPNFSEAPSAPMWPGQDDSEEQLSYNKRNILKWEKDEPLGDLSSISPVLYANMNHPELKTQYPDWNERAKQIAKIWRRVPPDAKTPYLAKARENRASSRLQRASKMVTQEPPKQMTMMSPMRGPPGQMLPPPPPRQKPISTEEKFMKEQRAIREQEQERQWKHLQQMRQQQAQERKIEAVISKVISEGEEIGGPESDAGSHGLISREGSLPGTPDSMPGPPQFAPPGGKPGQPWERDPFALPPGTPRPVPSVDQFPGPRPPMDPFSQPGTPRPEQPRPPMEHVRPMGPHDGFQGMPRPVDPYTLPPGVPRPGAPFTRPPGPRPENVGQAPQMPRIPDEIMRARMAQAAAEGFGHQGPRPGAPFPLPTPRPVDPFTQGQRKAGPQSPMPGGLRMQRPRMPLPDSFGPRGPAGGNIRPPESFQNRPVAPGQDLYAQQPGTPRPLPPDPYSQQPGTPVQRPPDHFGNMPPITRSSSQESFTHQQTSQASPVGPFPPGSDTQDVDPNLQQILSGERARFMEEKPNQLPTDPDAQKQEIQRQQLRELLAKQTKERQKQKEQDRLLQERSQMPLRHWPSQEEAPGQGPPSQPPPPPSQSFPSPGADVRPQGPGFPGQYGPRMMERWSDQQQQMIRPPHPNQIRPDGGQFSPHDVGAHGPFTPEWRGPRPGQPGPPMGQRMPQGQMRPPKGPGFIELRHPQDTGERPRAPFMQMFSERLRSPQPGLPSPRTSLPPGSAPNPLDPFDNVVRQQQQQQQQQQRQPIMEGTVRLSHVPDKQPIVMPPGSVAPAGCQAMSSPVQMHGQPLPVTSAPTATGPQMPGESSQQHHHPVKAPSDKPKTDDLDEPNDGEIDDLLGADGSFNLLEYADPELDNALHEATQDKTIFDEHLGLKKPTKEPKEPEKRPEEASGGDAGKAEVKSEEAADDKSDEGSKDSVERTKQVGDFQAQFLAFSRRMSEKEPKKENEGKKEEGVKEEIVMAKQESGSAVQSPQMAAVKQATSAQVSPTSSAVSTPSQVTSQSPMHSPQISALMQVSPRPGSHTPSSIPSPYGGPPSQMSPRVGVPSPFSQMAVSHASSLPSSPLMPDRNTPNQPGMLPSPQQQMPPVRPAMSSASNAATTHSALSQALASPSKAATQGLLPQEQQMLAMVQQRLQGPRGFRPPFPMQNKPYPTGSQPMQRPMGQVPMQASPGGRMPGPRGYPPSSQGMMQRMPGFPHPRMMEQRMMVGGAGASGMPPRGPGMTPGHATPPGMSPGGQVTPPGTPGAGPRQPMMPGAGQGLPPRMPMPRNPSPMTSPNTQVARELKERSLLLEEQPLLLEDLLEQKIEQRHQQEQQAMMQKQETGLLTDADFEKLRADIIGDAPRKPSPFPMGQPQGPSRMMSPHMDVPRMPHMGPQGARDSPQAFPRGPPPAYPGTPMGSRTPSPFAGPSGMYPPAHSPSMPHGPPGPPGQPGPPGPPGEHMMDPDRKQQAQYEEWLMHQMNVHSMQIKYLEQQVAKQRKAKKALNARQRQARKVGSELSEADAMDLERLTQELSGTQKQLDQVRKQQRQHQMVMQDYRTKQQERLGPNWPGPAPQGQTLPPSSMPSGPPGQQMMGPKGVPGQGTARLPASVRLEYEAYVQQRLRMMNPGMRQPMVTSGDNNPFSESYHDMERMRIQRQMQQQFEHHRQLHDDGKTEKVPGLPSGFKPPSSDVQSPGQMHPGFAMLPQYPSIEGGGFPGEPSKLDKPKKKRKKRAKKDQLAEGATAPAQLPSLSVGPLGSSPTMPTTPLSAAGSTAGTPTTSQPSTPLSAPPNPMLRAVEPIDTKSPASEQNLPKVESEMKERPVMAEGGEVRPQKGSPPNEEQAGTGTDGQGSCENTAGTDGQNNEENKDCTDDQKSGEKEGCTDGQHCGESERGTDEQLHESEGCTDGQHCGENEGCTDGQHCGENEGCTDGQHCGESEGCTDGMHCGESDGCTDGQHCGENEGCTDGIHCGENEGCTDGQHCGENEGCSDGMHCGENEGCSDGQHCGESEGCTDGQHCGKSMDCTDGQHCGEGEGCTDGQHCGENDGCTDGQHCGENEGCTDGQHCGENEGCTDGQHCGENEGCTDGKNCGENEGCTDGKHCGENKGCTDGQHCGENEGCTDGKHCGENEGCTDGQHCGENEGSSNGQSGCPDGQHCGENEGCTDGQHCGENKGCTDGQHCGENEGSSSERSDQSSSGNQGASSSQCSDGLHCGENDGQSDQKPANQDTSSNPVSTGSNPVSTGSNPVATGSDGGETQDVESPEMDTKPESSGRCSDGHNCPGNGDEKQEGMGVAEQTLGAVDVPFVADDTPMEVIEEQVIEEIPMDVEEVEISIEGTAEVEMTGVDLSLGAADIQQHEQDDAVSVLLPVCDRTPPQEPVAEPEPVAAPVCASSAETDTKVSPPAHIVPAMTSFPDVASDHPVAPTTLPEEPAELAQDLGSIPLPPSPVHVPPIEPETPASPASSLDLQLPETPVEVPTTSQSDDVSEPSDSVPCPPSLPEHTQEQKPEVSPDSTPMDLSVHREQPQPAHQAPCMETTHKAMQGQSDSPETLPEDLSMRSVKSDATTVSSREETPTDRTPLELKQEIMEEVKPSRSSTTTSPAHHPEALKSPKHPLPSPSEHRPLFTPPADASKSPKLAASPRRSPGAVMSPRRSPAAHSYPMLQSRFPGPMMVDIKPSAQELERVAPTSQPMPMPLPVPKDSIQIKTEPSEPSICSAQRSTPSKHLPIPVMAASQPLSQPQRPSSHPGHSMPPGSQGMDLHVPHSLPQPQPRASTPSSLPSSVSHAVGSHHHPAVPPGHPMFGQARLPGQPHLVHSGQGPAGHPHFHGQRMPMPPFGLHPQVRTSLPHPMSSSQNMQTFQQRPQMTQQTIMSRMSGPPPRPSPMIQHSLHPNRPPMPGQMPPRGLGERMPGDHLRLPGDHLRLPGDHLRMHGDPRMMSDDIRLPMPGDIRLPSDIRMRSEPRMPGDHHMPSPMGMHGPPPGMPGPGPRPVQQSGLFMPPVPMSSPNRMQLSPGAQTSRPGSQGSPASAGASIPVPPHQHSPAQAMPPSVSPGMAAHSAHSPIQSLPPSHSPGQPMPPHSHGQMHPQQILRPLSPGQGMPQTSLPMSRSPGHAPGPPSGTSPAKMDPETSKITANSEEKKISDALLDETIESVVAAAAGGQLLSPIDEDEEDFDESEAAQEEYRRNQNMLLKQLLASPNQEGRFATMRGGSDDDEPNIRLTPEQQRQLAAIDNMPLTMEMELSPEEWAAKSQEERDNIIEFLSHAEMNKKQDYVRKRKQFEEQQKKKKKRERKQQKARDKEGGEGPRKKRKKQKHSDQDYSSRMEAIMGRLRKMPMLQLQEPSMGTNVPASSMFGSGSAQNKLFGSFGNSLIDGVSDFYSQPPFVLPPPPQPKPQGVPQAFERNLHGERVPKLPSDAGGFLPKSPISMLMQKDKEQEQMKREQERAQLAQKGILGAQRPRTPSLPPPPLIEARLPSRASSTPDSMVSCSSPECFMGEKLEKLPLLKVIKEEPKEGEDTMCESPVIPVIAPVAIKPSPVKVKTEKEQKGEKILDDPELGEFIMKEKENLATMDTPFEREAYAKKIAGLSAFTRPLKDSSFHENQVSVTLTLSAPAADDINHVIFAIAELLKIAVPPSYEISRSTSPDHFKFGKKFGFERKHKEEAVNIHSLIKSKVKFCRHCDVAIQDIGIRKRMKDIPHLSNETAKEGAVDEEVTFCSMNCYMQFAITHRSISTLTQKKDGSNVVEHKSDHDRGSGFGTQTKAQIPYPQLPKVGDVAKAVKLRRRSNSMDNKPIVKKWKGTRYRRVDSSFTHPGKKYSPPSETELDELRRLLDMMVIPEVMPDDIRKCVLCFQLGDLDSTAEGRLLNMDIDKWIHLNCALWSSEVYETLNGALMNVDTAVKRGLMTECTLCTQGGATITCFKQRCSNVYHLGCALEAKCMFFQDKTILCPIHAPKGHPENELLSLEVYRKVYVNRDENRQLAKMIQEEDRNHTIRIGALTFHNIGQLLPHQLQTGKFHTKLFIYPVGFRTSRFYWSMRYVNKRCRYDCSIIEAEGRPEFIVKVEEKGHDPLTLRDSTPKAVWSRILDKVEKMRNDAQLVKVFPSFLSGEDMFGLGEPAIIRIIESLPGVELLRDYGFRYGRSPLIELPLAINPTGCARSEPKFRTHFRKPHCLQSSSSSRSIPSTVTGFSGDMNSPYMKQFVHSKSQQYRKLKTEWQNNVYLGRSRIQGLGLFAARDLEKHTMVIEYIGQLIRNEVAEKREKEYEAQNRGTYMFRLESDYVVDATLTGGHARYVNHCCQPNCVAEVVPFEKESKIIIIANRRVVRGEELTYDYKFDFEDDKKIPCLCGAPNCRKWMN